MSAARTLFIDRIEDEVAVLLDEDGASHLIACTLLPEAAREGDRVSIDVSLIAAEPDASRALAARRRTLSRDDDGGDIEL